MSFPKQAALATLVVSACVVGLVWLGRSSQSSIEPPGGPAERGQAPPPQAPLGTPGPFDTPEEEIIPGDLPKSAPGASVRMLVPQNAWAVADFRGDLTGQRPFEDQPGMCATVPAPERVALAVLPPGENQEPDLLIAARRVEDTFWGCARDRIVRAGGTALAQNERYEVLKSPSGVVARGPDGSLVFLTGERHLEAALAVISELEPSAFEQGRHSALYSRMYSADRPARPSMLDLTVAPPADWLSSVGQDARKSPLRHIRSGFVGAYEDGSAQGGIDCEEAGCPEVVAFLERAEKDLVAGLPSDLGGSIGDAFRAEHLVGTGRIALTWNPQNLPLGKLLGRFFPGGPLGP